MRITITSHLLRVILFALLTTTFTGCQDAKSEKEIPSMYYTDSIYSENLQEYRKHNVYLPKDFDQTKSYGIIYGTDGEEYLADSFIKSALDSLINTKSIVPVIYIGSHSNSREVPGSKVQMENGETFAMQFRFLEYVEPKKYEDAFPGLEQIFTRHLRYFTEELIPKVESEFDQDLSPKDRLFYGVSNGAGFGANLINKSPSIIGTYICFSTLGSNVENNYWDLKTSYPDLYLQYGDQETGSFVLEAELLRDKYRDSGSFCQLKVYKGGHDFMKWNEEFVKTIAEILQP